PKLAVGDGDRVEPPDAVDVHQPFGPREAKVEERHEALPPGEHLGLLPVLREQRDRLLDRARVVVLERRRLHAAIRASSTTRCGDSGRRSVSTPSASATAFAIAAPAAAVPPSPAPFAPSGFRGVGASSVTSTSTGGVSPAVGSR